MELSPRDLFPPDLSFFEISFLQTSLSLRSFSRSFYSVRSFSSRSFSMCADTPAIVAFDHMAVDHKSSVGIMDENGELIGSLSVRCNTRWGIFETLEIHTHPHPSTPIHTRPHHPHPSTPMISGFWYTWHPPGQFWSSSASSVPIHCHCEWIWVYGSSGLSCWCLV